MGMDVIGRDPISEEGEYFRASVWGWHPLATYMEAVAPPLMRKVQYLHSNDGDGLGATDASALADILVDEIESGRAAQYVKDLDGYLDSLPSEPCKWCDATGTRTDKVGVDLGYAARGYCNGCEGKGSVRPFECSYRIEVTDIEEFATFAAHSGGFEIH